MRHYFALAYLLAACVCVPSVAQNSPAKPAANSADDVPSQLPQLSHVDPSWIDTSKNPCEDYYQYACSKWIVAHPIPADMPSTWTGNAVLLYNQTVLGQAMRKAAENPQATGGERQIGNFWRSCMDESGRNKNEKTWLEPALNEIASMKSTQDLARVLAYLHLNYGTVWLRNLPDTSTQVPFFGFGPTQDMTNATRMVGQIDQGGMALDTVSHYLDRSADSEQLRGKYLAHIQKMFVLLGESVPRAAAEAKTVVEIETALAKASMDNVSRRDPQNKYNKRTLQQLKAAVPAFDWDEYFNDIGAPAVPFYVVTAPTFLPVLQQQISTRSLGDLATYLRWWTVHLAAPSLGDDFEHEDFGFFGTSLFGGRLAGASQMLPRWQRCVIAADESLGFGALGKAYVDVAFPGDSKLRANEIVTRIRAALREEIEHLDWLDPTTKKQALAKEEATLQVIGYPDKWRDYSSVTIVPDNYLANKCALTNFEARRQFNKIGKPVDRTEWWMPWLTPASFNAYEDAQLNSISFPAGILQLPMFGAQQDDATNYGGAGAAIGHEIIHGFDDQGRKFDAEGNLRNWWTGEDAKRYEQKDKCIVDQYSQEIPEYGLRQNGRLTAGEDTADNGGLHLAMLALEAFYREQEKSLDTPGTDGVTPRQQFFFSYAFNWCGNLREQAARQALIADPHSLPVFRLNRPLSNLPEFQKAYSCKAGQPMVHEPQCRVW
jgi:putative endopeptidase